MHPHRLLSHCGVSNGCALLGILLLQPLPVLSDDVGKRYRSHGVLGGVLYVCEALADHELHVYADAASGVRMRVEMKEWSISLDGAVDVKHGDALRALGELGSCVPGDRGDEPGAAQLPHHLPYGARIAGEALGDGIAGEIRTLLFVNEDEYVKRVAEFCRIGHSTPYLLLL